MTRQRSLTDTKRLQARIHAFLLVALLTCGCSDFQGASPPLVPTYQVNPEMASRLNDEVKLYQPAEVPSLKYESIRTLQSWSCKHLLWDPAPSEEDALAQMRLQASSFGANGIIDVHCSSEGTGSSVIKDCWSMMECDGTAIRVDSGPSNPLQNTSGGSGGR